MDGICVLCKEEEESRDHMFFGCSYSKKIWQEVLKLCGLTREIVSWQEEVAWAIQRLRGKALISLLLKIAWNAVIYMIWT